MKQIASFLALSLLPSIAVVFTAQPVHAQQISVRIRLNGPAIAGIPSEGKSEYKVSGAKRSFRVEVKANIADGTVLLVTVNGALVGAVTITAGVGSLTLDTERGQVVPSITPGTTVAARIVTGNMVASGTF